MERWLQTFPYRHALSFVPFFLIASMVLLVSITTVAVSILKISRMKAVRLIADQ
jgi:hypothetical protein